MSDPMDAVELEQIRQRIDRTPVVPFTIAEPGVARVQMSDLRRIVHDAMSLLCEVERLRAALGEVESAAGAYLAEHGIHGFHQANTTAEDALVGIKDAAESALKA